MQEYRKPVPNDLTRETPQRQLQLLRRHQESNSMLGILMAGIAGLFILAIVAAYNYASQTSVAENQSPRPAASAPETTGSAAQAPASRAETTGAGTAERGPAAMPGQRGRAQPDEQR